MFRVVFSKSRGKSRLVPAVKVSEFGNINSRVQYNDILFTIFVDSMVELQQQKLSSWFN
jgi:hypothetical protein